MINFNVDLYDLHEFFVGILWRLHVTRCYSNTCSKLTVEWSY